MAQEEEQVELKFRIYDGTDICHSTYSSSTMIENLKQMLVAEWPQDKTTTPNSVNDVKLIHAGKFLDNNKTLAESKVTSEDLSGEAITMHVVVQPAVDRKKPERRREGTQKQNSCRCVIL